MPCAPWGAGELGWARLEGAAGEIGRLLVGLVYVRCTYNGGTGGTGGTGGAGGAGGGI